MANILDVAKYIKEFYKQISNQDIDEMKLQKLLYFCQREYLALMNKPLFNENMEGWVLGPVSPIVHENFAARFIFAGDSSNLTCDEQTIIRNVVYQYGSIESWKLSQISHNEISWINSRKGLQKYDRGNVALKIEDIKKDAEKVRPFDQMWGMYFEDFYDKEVELI